MEYIKRYEQLRMIRRAEYLARIMFELKRCIDESVLKVNDLTNKMQELKAEYDAVQKMIDKFNN